ncbi:hypothetical protein ACSTJ1_00795, partial [Vibrio parahaemolyticus]
HLNCALCDKAKFLGFSKFNLFGQPFFGFGKSAFSPQILESLKPQNMPKFVKLPQLKIAFGRGKFVGCKVWKGQVHGKPAFAEILAR